jgi:hypothetical protein
MKPDKVTFRSDWLNLISTLSVQEQQRLCYAVLLRLFGSAVPEMTGRAEVIYSAIERDILHSEIKRENVRKRWASHDVCMIQSNVQSNVQSSVQSNIHSNVHSNVLCMIQNPSETAGTEGAGACASEARPTPECAPARADKNNNKNNNINNINNNTESNRKKKILKKESAEPQFAELFPPNLRCPEMLAKWQEWIHYRKSRKKPVSEFAARRQIGMLAELPLLEALASIEQSISNDYQGLFPPRRSGKAVPDKPQTQKDHTGI